jgi:uncharacterized protein YidB (DUF937 family)
MARWRDPGSAPARMRTSRPKDLANALGSDALNTLSRQSGLSVDELLAGFSQHLPDLVDQLTPKGRLPTEEEAARMV